MQITDNALNVIEFKMLLKYFTSEAPIWRFLTNVTHGYTNEPQKSWGFACDIFNCGDKFDGLPGTQAIAQPIIGDKVAFKLLKPLIINKEKLMRIRCGLIVNIGPREPHIPHIDQPGTEHWTQMYYLTSNDSPTNIFEEYGLDPKYDNYKPEDFTLKFQSKPEPNRMFTFDGYHYHSSSCVSDNKMRLALTFNYAK
tara:strand:+ start:20 stop:607 length:588 start_codon:yes stop_codon:yes gene_type:complete